MQQLGDYKLVEKIGAGGMGEVWLAENVHMHKRYALKLLPEAATRDSNFVARFFDEGRVMSELKHPNIVPVHHVGHDKESGRYYLVMDFVAGADGESQSLHDLLQASADNRLPEADVRKWAVQIAEGLAYAHKQGIVHRDIKPANILIDADNNAQIADFGLAKAVGDEYIQTQIHQSIQHSMSGSLGDQPTIPNAGAERKRSSGSRPIEGTLDGLDTIQPGQSSIGTHRSTAESILGTYDYMSPEQRNELPGTPVGPPSDIYAYGVMLYRLLTGRRPAGRFKDPSVVVPGLSPMWDPVVDCCLAHMPADRYADGTELLAALTPPTPKITSAPTASMPKNKPSSRRAVVIAAVVVVVLGILGLLTSSSDSESASPVEASAGYATPVAPKRLPSLKSPVQLACDPSPATISRRQQVTLKPDLAATVYYTLDGSSPDEHSAKYESPLTIQPGAKIRCLAIRKGHGEQTYTFSFPAAVIPSPQLHPSSGQYDGEITVSVPRESLPAGVSWRYTLDGSTPSASSPVLSEPLKLYPPARLQVRGVGGDIPSGPIASVRYTIPVASLEKAFLLQAQARRAKQSLPTLPDTPRFSELSKSLSDAWTAGEKQLAAEESSQAAMNYSRVLNLVGQIERLVVLRKKAMDRYAAFGTKLASTEATLVAVVKPDFDTISRSYAEDKKTLTAEQYAKSTAEIASLEKQYVTWLETSTAIRDGQRDWPMVQANLSVFTQAQQDALHAAHSVAQLLYQKKSYAQAAEKYAKISIALAKVYHAASQEVKLAKTGIRFRLIPAGSFTMGSNNGGSDEKPAHRVTLTKPFYMGMYEITQGQWEKVMGTRPWSGKTYAKSNSDHAVSYVSWEDARSFIKKLEALEGLPKGSLKLPTEAQWEYACRAGTSTAYVFGDKDSALGEYAWYRKNAYDVGQEYAHAVGQKKPNAWGLYDMHGNVWEWCNDWYGEDCYASSPKENPKGPNNGTFRVLRGGCWGSGARNCRSANRYWDSPGSRDDLNGFRLSLDFTP